MLYYSILVLVISAIFMDYCQGMTLLPYLCNVYLYVACLRVYWMQGDDFPSLTSVR